MGEVLAGEAGGASVVKVHHVPVLASVVPAALRARICHSYFVFQAKPVNAIDRVASTGVVVHVPPSHVLFTVASMQYSKLVALVLAAHVSVTVPVAPWPVALFAGADLLNAPGNAGAAVVKLHHVPALPSVVPALLRARTCQ